MRAKLTERFGPDFENTTVGQMALQNFSRERNEAFATWMSTRVMDRWQKYALPLRERMRAALEQVAAARDLSRDVREIVGKALAP